MSCDSDLQALGDGFRPANEQGCSVRRSESASRLAEQLKPAGEMDAIDIRNPGVDHHRSAVEAPAHQHHRRPEVAHGLQVSVPAIADFTVEDRPQHGVGADCIVEAVDKGMDHRLGYADGRTGTAGVWGTDSIIGDLAFLKDAFIMYL